MRNRPHINWEAESFEEDDSSRSTNENSPTLRCGLLIAVLLIPLATIAARLTFVQRHLGPTFAAAWETTTTVEEPLPCRDGRILSADGQVLAQDRLRFDVQVHYRWIEAPADEGWVKQRALAQLTRRDRRDPDKVAAAKESVFAERRRLWDLLATTTNRSRHQLDEQRVGIQRRVERVIQSVTERRDAKLAEVVEQVDPREAVERLRTLDATPADLQHIRDAIVGELTAPPQRQDNGPIVVAEELSYHVVIENVDLRVVAQIESAPSLFPGVRMQAASERIYPDGDMAPHIVGVRTDATPDELGKELDDADVHVRLREGDRIGRTGIERALDQTLRGRRGKLHIVKDRRGEILSQSIVEQPLHGRDVVLTLDAGLQRTAERLLDEAIGQLEADEQTGEPEPTRGRSPNGGCLIAIDVRTGDVITAAAAPRFDLGLLLHPDPEEWKTATSDPRRPFFPRVTQMMVPPGSVFKILTSIALLESRLIDPNQPVFCQGYLDRPDRNRCYIYRHYGIGHGDMTLSDAICQSCNVYFFHAARSLGPKPIADWAARFGLGIATGGEVPGEKGGHLPKADATGRVVDEDWYDGSTLQFAIGQASLTVTPLQVARLVAAVANDGYLVTPRFVRDQAEDSPSDNGSVQLVGFSSSPSNLSAGIAPTVRRIAGLSPNTLASVRNGMRMVVENHQGTGRKVRLDDVSVAGKTGTAEVGGGKKDHAWFVGFVPADAPRYAFVVVIEHGGSGGSVAAPIARDFIEEMLDAGVLPRNAD